MLNLDTHILLHALGGALTPRERRLLAASASGISGIVFSEIGKRAQLRRIEVDLEHPDVERALGAIHVWPTTLDVARAIGRLDVRVDPADELIAATSLVHRVPLLTRDRRLLASEILPLA